jgi:hypothetical protein
MSHPLHHAQSSSRKFGGTPEDYQAIHDWFDATKAHLAHFNHRALRHHAAGIFEAERVFGVFIVNSDGKQVPVRFIGEQHVKEDCGGRIPTVADWVAEIPYKRWMSISGIETTLNVDDQDPALTQDGWIAAVMVKSTILGFDDWVKFKTGQI